MANSTTAKNHSADSKDHFGNQASERPSAKSAQPTAPPSSKTSAQNDLEDARQRIEHLEAELETLRKAQSSNPSASASQAEPVASRSAKASVLESIPASENPSEDGTRNSESADQNSGLAELRKDSMMAHLLDSLDAGKDIGHYGRLVFAMVARHFLPAEQVVSWLNKDSDFTQPAAEALMTQVEGRDYNPPRRDRILEWQSQQDFPILPDPHDPDCGNLYRTLKFPDHVYQHIQHYQEDKA